jgi:hypothetical protein
MRILSSLAILTSIAASPLSAAPQPNIILILSDDQDWNGLSAAMHPDMPNSKSDFYRTPNLEKFAAQAMRFSNGYAPAPVCSPTRICVNMQPTGGHFCQQVVVPVSAPGQKFKRLLEFAGPTDSGRRAMNCPGLLVCGSRSAVRGFLISPVPTFAGSGGAPCGGLAV